jgi:hypothetical protein
MNSDGIANLGQGNRYKVQNMFLGKGISLAHTKNGDEQFWGNENFTHPMRRIQNQWKFSHTPRSQFMTNLQMLANTKFGQSK